MNSTYDRYENSAYDGVHVDVTAVVAAHLWGGGGEEGGRKGKRKGKKRIGRREGSFRIHKERRGAVLNRTLKIVPLHSLLSRLSNSITTV
jgi:hypothetical protein